VSLQLREDETGSLLVESKSRSKRLTREDLFLTISRQALRPSFLSLEFGHDYGISPMSEANRLETSVQGRQLAGVSRAGVYRSLQKKHSALDYRPPVEFEQAASPDTSSQGATMSFFRPKPLPLTLIVSMSLRLAIPRRVGLHQSPLPLRQPGTIVAQKGLVNYGKPLNSKCAKCILSQRRGSPHKTVPTFVPPTTANDNKWYASDRDITARKSMIPVLLSGMLAYSLYSWKLTCTERNRIAHQRVRMEGWRQWRLGGGEIID
jgi:hypothetical protein